MKLFISTYNCQADSRFILFLIPNLRINLQNFALKFKAVVETVGLAENVKKLVIAKLVFATRCTERASGQTY